MSHCGCFDGTLKVVETVGFRKLDLRQEILDEILVDYYAVGSCKGKDVLLGQQRIVISL